MKHEKFRKTPFARHRVGKVCCSAVISLGLLTAPATTAAAATLVGPFVPGSGNWTTVPNGGFESGLTSWTPFLGTIGSATTVSDPAAVGNSSLKLAPTVNKTGAGYAVQQTVAVTPGVEYVLSGFFNTRDLTAHALRLDLGGAAFSIPVGWMDLAIGEEQWQFSWETFTPNVSSVLVRAVHDFDMRLGEAGYFDEIAITPSSEFFAATVPLPGALPLLGGGLGLLGLLGWRRKWKAAAA